MIKILAGGPAKNWPTDLFNKNQDDIWIGADFGAYSLIKNDILPVMIVGDFDSLNQQQKNELFTNVNQSKIVQVNAEKDETDLELALNSARDFLNQDDQINIYGATGGRLDHELSNLTILAKTNFKDLIDKTSFIDSQNKVTYFNPGRHQIKNDSSYKYLAFMNIAPVENFEILDAKYKLDETSNQIPIMYSSNEFENQTVDFRFDQGIMMVVQSKDA